MSELRAAAVAGRPELDLLLECARVRLGPGRAERVAALLRGRLDRAGLVRIADRHGVAPLLFRHVGATGPDALPPAALGHLRERSHASAARGLLLTGELLRLLELLDAQGVVALPFKGPTLAALAYGDVALRSFGDIDLLLGRADVPRAKELLVGRGYRLVFPVRPTQEAAYLATVRQLPLVCDRTGSVVELHTHVTPRAFPFALDLVGLRERQVGVTLDSQEVPAPSPEDLLLLLSAHGAKHVWSCLSWICDVAELLRACPRIDWTRVTGQADLLRSRRVLHLALLLAHELLDAPLPPEMAAAAHSSAAVRQLAAHVCQTLFREGDGTGKGLSKALFHLRARERLRDGLSYSLSLALTPTVADWTMVAVPASLSFLYYLFRPLRLARKYGRKLLGGPA
jgi:hypothetical protein